MIHTFTAIHSKLVINYLNAECSNGLDDQTAFQHSNVTFSVLSEISGTFAINGTLLSDLNPDTNRKIETNQIGNNYSLTFPAISDVYVSFISKHMETIDTAMLHVQGMLSITVSAMLFIFCVYNM